MQLWKFDCFALRLQHWKQYYSTATKKVQHKYFPLLANWQPLQKRTPAVRWPGCKNYLLHIASRPRTKEFICKSVNVWLQRNDIILCIVHKSGKNASLLYSTALQFVLSDRNCVLRCAIVHSAANREPILADNFFRASLKSTQHVASKQHIFMVPIWHNIHYDLLFKTQK